MLTLAQLLIRVLAFLSIILALGDVITTNGALGTGQAREANPVMALVQRVLGSKWVIARLAYNAAGIAAAFVYDGTWAGVALLGVGNALTGYAVWNNWKIWKAGA